MVRQLFHRFMQLPYLLRLLAAVIFILLVFGVVIHILEPRSFPTLFEGIWWAIVTTSTIGYGDYVPETTAGKFTAMLLIFSGAGLVASYFVAIASTAIKRQGAILKGTVRVYWKDHIIIVGWNERTKGIIQNIRKFRKNQPVVLIDSSLEESPDPQDIRLMFVKGHAFSDETLLQAHIKEAKMIIVTADPTRSEFHADMNTVLIIVAVKGLAPNVHCIAEILTKEQMLNAKRAGADEIIQSNKLISSVMNHTMLSPHVSTALLHMVDSQIGVQIKFLDRKNLSGRTFASAAENCLKNGSILIGFQRNNETFIAPDREEVLQESDKLLIIHHEQPGPGNNR